MKTPNELASRFRQEGLRMTPQRYLIFEVLADNPHHPSAESVFASVRARMPTVSLKTVYQTLNDLVALGELSYVDLGSGPRRFDPSIRSHHHLICESCGKIVDLYADFTGLTVPEEQRQGFVIGTADVVFRGQCDQCLKQQETRASLFVDRKAD